MTTRSERAVDRTRRFVGRVAAPLLTRHDGRLWLARRAVTTTMSRVSYLGKPPADVTVVPLVDVAAESGVRVEHPEPGLPVVHVDGGVVLGPWGHTAVPGQRVVDELSCSDRRPDRLRTRREASASCAGPVVELAGTTANVAQNHFGNYANWMLRGAVRCELVHATIGFAACDHVLVAPLPPFAHGILDSYGVTPSQLVEMPLEPGQFRCEHLVAPAEPRDLRWTPPWAIERLRARFGAPPTGDAPRRVYLGRGDADRRRVLNDAEVRARLERRGFVSVSMDGRPIHEQAALLAGAECVVAVHGAALANLVFAPRDATVVELTYRNWPMTMYRDLCATIGQPYHAVPGREPALWPVFGTPALIDADTVVDVAALSAALDAAGVR